MSIISSKDLEGQRVTAIDTGLNPRAFAQTKLSEGSSENGFLLYPDGTVETWNLTGNFCELDSNKKERIFMYRDFFNGISLIDIVEGQDARKAWKVLHQFVLTIEKVGGIYKKELLSYISSAGPDSVLYSEDGVFLVFPRDMYIRCASDNGEKIEVQTRLHWVHPDIRLLSESIAFAFMIGALGYRILTSEKPFTPQKTDGTLIEQISRLIRKRHYIPIETSCYGISKEGANILSSMLDGKEEPHIASFLALGPALSDVIEKDDPIPSAFLEKKSVEKRKLANKAKCESFIRRNKGTFIFVSIMAAFVGLLGQQYMHEQGKKPTSLGLRPIEVVTGFYEAIASLEQEIPQAYMAKDIKNNYIEYVMHLYITSRVQLAYDQSAGTMSPMELFQRNGIYGKKAIYGMSHLNITPLFEQDKTAKYTVSFYYWLPVSPIPEGTDVTRSADIPIQLSIYHYSDEVTLQWFTDRWKISEIIEGKRTVVEEYGENVIEAVMSKNYEKFPWLPK